MTTTPLSQHLPDLGIKPPLTQLAIPLKPYQPPQWLITLLSYTPFYGQAKPEAQLCLYICEQLTRLAVNGKLKGVFFHVPNEGALGKVTRALFKAMGVISGVPDYIHLKADKPLLIEIKTLKGATSKRQREFRMWCALHGIPCVEISAGDPGQAWALYQAVLVEHGFMAGVA